MSEDTEKIIALIIVALAFLSLPVLLFSIVLFAALDMSYILEFMKSGSSQDWLFVAGFSALLAFLIALFVMDVQWLKKTK